MSGEIKKRNTPEQTLLEIAKFAIGSDEANKGPNDPIKGGAGRIGIINGRVVKFNTHWKERWFGPHKNDDMRRSCNELRMTLYANASQFMKPGDGDTLRRIREKLGLDADGYVRDGADLLDRTTVAEVINLVDGKLWEKINVAEVEALKTEDARGRAIDTHFASLPENRISGLRDNALGRDAESGYTHIQTAIRDRLAGTGKFKIGDDGRLAGIGQFLIEKADLRCYDAYERLDAAGKVSFLENYDRFVREAVDFVFGLYQAVSDRFDSSLREVKFFGRPGASGDLPSARGVKLRASIVPDALFRHVYDNCGIVDKDIGLQIALRRFEKWVAGNDLLEIARSESVVLERYVDVALRFADRVEADFGIDLPDSVLEDVMRCAHMEITSGKWNPERLEEHAEGFASIFRSVYVLNRADLDKTMRTFYRMLSMGVAKPKYVDYAQVLVKEVLGSGMQIPEKLTKKNFERFCNDLLADGGVLARIDEDLKDGGPANDVANDAEGAPRLFSAFLLMLMDVNPALRQCLERSDAKEISDASVEFNSREMLDDGEVDIQKLQLDLRLKNVANVFAALKTSKPAQVAWPDIEAQAVDSHGGGIGDARVVMGRQVPPVQQVGAGVQYENVGDYAGAVPVLQFPQVEAVRGRSGNDTSVPPAFRELISAVEDNPGGGHCLFYSAMDFVDHLRSGVQSDAEHLRAAMIANAERLMDHARKHPQSPGLRYDGVQAWTVNTSRGRVNVTEAVGQIRNKSVPDRGWWGQVFERNGYADVTNGAFLADLLKRPVVILSQPQPPYGASYEYCFDCELEGGQRLRGEPICILHTGVHFRSFTPTEAMLRRLGLEHA